MAAIQEGVPYDGRCEFPSIAVQPVAPGAASRRPSGGSGRQPTLVPAVATEFAETNACGIAKAGRSAHRRDGSGDERGNRTESARNPAGRAKGQYRGSPDRDRKSGEREYAGLQTTDSLVRHSSGRLSPH